jgi:hypothetical protein
MTNPFMRNDNLQKLYKMNNDLKGEMTGHSMWELYITKTVGLLYTDTTILKLSVSDCTNTDDF